MVILGIDWGEKRIGVALSWSGAIASPHSVVPNHGLDDAAERILRICEQVEAEMIVLGVPAGARHDAAAIRDRYEAIAELLRQKSCRPVELWDESYSTTEALAQQKESGKTSRKHRAVPIDSRAAAVILQSWLDTRPTKEISTR